MVYFGEPLGHVITLCGQILVSRTDDDPPPPRRVSISKRARVYVQNVPVCTGTTRTCVSTCARGAGTHGDVLNVHTGTFWMDTRGFQRATQHTQHTHHNTRHNNTTTRPHHHSEIERDGDRERDRQEKTGTGKKTKQEERQREDETRQEGKRREKMKQKT